MLESTYNNNNNIISLYLSHYSNNIVDFHIRTSGDSLFFFHILIQLEEHCSSSLSFFHLTIIITTSTSVTQHNQLHLHHRFTCQPLWHCTSARLLAFKIIINIIYNIFLFPSSFLHYLHILLFTPHFEGRVKPAMCIGKALVRAPSVPERSHKLYSFFISSSHRYGGLHLTSPHHFDLPTSPVKRPELPLAQPAVCANHTLTPTPTLLYISQNLHIYYFFIIPTFCHAFIYSVFLLFFSELSPIYLSYSLFLMTPRLPYGGFYFVFLF